MTVNEMIERLQEIAGDGFGESDLRLAFQPSWPLQFEIGGIAVPDEEPDNGAPVVYVVEGSHPDGDSPYAPSWAFALAQ